jgi:hypothetical protein
MEEFRLSGTGLGVIDSFANLDKALVSPSPALCFVVPVFLGMSERASRMKLMVRWILMFPSA